MEADYISRDPEIMSGALSKLNYRIHTDAIKAHLIPATVTRLQASITYANEADILNVALFGLTAKQWREANPRLEGNMREYATVEQLLVLANIEGMNAELIATPLSPAPLPAGDPAQRSTARILWALLLARIYEILPLRCTLCGGEIRILAFITEAPARHAILTSLGEPTTPPEVAPARGPPLWDQAPEPVAHWEDTPAPVPEFVFDQRLSW